MSLRLVHAIQSLSLLGLCSFSLFLHPLRCVLWISLSSGTSCSPSTPVPFSSRDLSPWCSPVPEASASWFVWPGLATKLRRNPHWMVRSSPPLSSVLRPQLLGEYLWLLRRPSLGLCSTEPSRILQQHCSFSVGSRLKITFPVLNSTM